MFTKIFSHALRLNCSMVLWPFYTHWISCFLLFLMKSRFQPLTSITSTRKSSIQLKDPSRSMIRRTFQEQWEGAREMGRSGTSRGLQISSGPCWSLRSLCLARGIASSSAQSWTQTFISFQSNWSLNSVFEMNPHSVNKVASKKTWVGLKTILNCSICTHKKPETYGLIINCQGLNSGFCLKTGIPELTQSWM